MNPDAVRQAEGSWKAVVSVLEEAGVTSVFGLPGDDLDVLAALADSVVHFTLCRDQRNAVFMATGYAVQSGGLGVVVVGKGPAVTNTVTGLLEARGSAAPVLLLSGGTSAEHRGTGAFQELDQISVIRPLAKWAATVDHPDRLVPLLHRAMLVARHGVPGPVYLELPDHLSARRITLPASGAPPAEWPASVGVTADSPALQALRQASRPMVLVGGGLRHRNKGRRVERFAEALGAAVACTASGRGAVDESLPLFCGLSGLYAPELAKALWAETDCVIALGTRLEETATYGWPHRLGNGVPVIQVNVDATEFATHLRGPDVLADAGAVLDAWMACAPGRPEASGWAERVRGVHRELRAAHRKSLRELHASTELHVAEVLEALDEVLPPDRILVQENGLQDMWSYRFPVYACDGRAGSVAPSEQTSLGFGAAAAVGVKRAAPDRPVVAFVGDGAFGLFQADVPTALAQGGLLYVVLRNGGYGWLQSQLDQRERPIPGFSFVDPALVHSSFAGQPGLRHFTVRDKATLLADVAAAWKLCASGQTVVLDVPVRLGDAMFAATKAAGDFPAPSGSG